MPKPPGGVRATNAIRASPAASKKISMLLDQVLPTPRGRGLDAGCGTGIFSRELARRGWRVTAFDASPEMISVASAATPDNSIEFLNQSYQTYRTDPKSFDVILSLSALEYVENDDDAIENFAQILKPGGVLVISVPNRKGLLRVLEGAALGVRQITRGRLFGGRGAYLVHQKHQYSPLELNLMMREHGLKKIRATFLNAGFSNPKWLFPLFERRWWAAMYCAAYKKI